MSIHNLYHLFDLLQSDLRDLHPADRLSGAARMVARPSLVGDQLFRDAFSCWRKEVAL